MDTGVNEKEVKKTRTKVRIAVVMLVVLTLLAGGLTGLKFLYGNVNPFKVVVSTVLNSTYEKLNYNAISGNANIKISGNSTTSEDVNQVLSTLSKVNLSVNYGVDYTNKMSMFELDSKFNNQDLINANAYLQNGNGYVYLENIYDKYIMEPVEDVDKLFDNKKQDLAVIVSSVNKGLDIALKEEYFVKEKVDMNSSKVLKTSLTVDKTNYSLIKNDFINYLITDQNFLNSYSKLMEKTVEEVKSDLNKELSNNEFEDSIVMAVYTSGKDFVMLEVISGKDKITISKNGNDYTIDVYEESISVYTIGIIITDINTAVKYVITLTDNKSKDTYQLELTNSIKYNSQITLPDLSNSKASSDLTEEEKSQITDKLLSSQGILELMKELSGDSSSVETLPSQNQNFSNQDLKVNGI